MKTKEASRSRWYNRKGSALALVVVSLGLAYLLASRAIDTGSLQQYAVTIALVAFAVNRSIHVTFGHRRMHSQGNTYES